MVMIDAVEYSDDLYAYIADRAAATAVHGWAHEHGLTVAVPRRPWRRRGGSGAILVLIDLYPVAQAGEPMGVLLKVCSAGSPAREPAGYQNAWRESAEFAERHLHRQCFPPRELADGRVLMFLDSPDLIAGSRTLGHLPGAAQRDGAAETMRLILSEWNDSAGRRRGAVTVHDFLRVELRGALERGRSAYHWLDRNGLLPTGEDHREPLATKDDLVKIIRAVGLDSHAGNATMEYLYGNSHGDLHLDNVVILPPTEPIAGDRIRLIDLSAFDHRAPLSRDVASLLLSAILPTVRAELPTGDTRALVRLLTASDPQSVAAAARSDAERAVHAIRAAVLEEIGSEFHHRFHAQYLLSLTAQALVYTSYSNVERTGHRWYFALACEAAAAFQASSVVVEQKRSSSH